MITRSKAKANRIGSKRPAPVPEGAELFNFERIKKAKLAIKNEVKETPLEVCICYSLTRCLVTPVIDMHACIPELCTYTQFSPLLSEKLKMNIYLKKEFRLPTGR